MKKADAIVQALLLLFTVISLLLSVAINRGFGYCIFYLHLIITVWQIVSAMEMLRADHNYKFRQLKQAKVYLSSLLVYLLGFAIVCNMHSDTLVIWWFFSGWLPVLFYTAFTLQLAFAKAPKRKTFMDILN